MTIMEGLFILLGTILLIWCFIYAILHLPLSTTTPTQSDENYQEWLDFQESDGINPDAPWD